MSKDKNRVCPVELAGSLDNKFRRWIQNPSKILAPYIKEGMTVVDVGCGPGFFSIEMAKMTGMSGKVVAADLQEGMLQKIGSKIKGTFLEEIIKPVKCEKDALNVSVKADFILCFYMVHEVPGKEKFFEDLKNILADKGKILIVEPAFHVTAKEFETTMRAAAKAGFAINAAPKMLLNRSSVLTKIQ